MSIGKMISAYIAIFSLLCGLMFVVKNDKTIPALLSGKNCDSVILSKSKAYTDLFDDALESNGFDSSLLKGDTFSDFMSDMYIDI